MNQRNSSSRFHLAMIQVPGVEFFGLGQEPELADRFLGVDRVLLLLRELIM